jgi:hypothetical protein
VRLVVRFPKMKKFSALIRYEKERGPEAQKEIIRFNFEGDKEPLIECSIGLDQTTLDKAGNPFLWICEMPEKYFEKIDFARKFKVLEGDTIVGYGVVQLEI